jgi:trans-aconitate 2-methyltransferase
VTTLERYPGSKPPRSRRSEVARDYAFGDTDEAARRLGVLADIFDPASEAFLADQVSRPPMLAVDLGCGPGHSTRLLARVTRATRTVGLDNSESFLAAARKNAAGGLAFLIHDVRNTPWPVAGADLAFSRLVLAHLPEPAAVTMTWLAQLAPGGLLALDELEWFHTDDPALDRYLEIATALVTAHGGTMLAGPILAELDPVPMGRRQASMVREWEVAVPRAAAMFGLNLAVWRRDPLVPASQAELDKLSRELDALASAQASGGTMTWGLRQVVLQSQ